MVVQARNLNLPNNLSPFTTLLFEPNSLSLALMHMDSSFSLYTSLQPFFPISKTLTMEIPQTLKIPPPISSSTFLLLDPNPNSTNHNPQIVFVVAGPHSSGSAILLRFYILCKKEQLFRKCRVVCDQKGLRFDSDSGVVVDARHGVSVKIYGAVNIMAMYSVSNSRIWVFAAKIGSESGDQKGVIVKLMKCAVIECCVPVWSISVSYGYLILGEDNGVRVFALRPLVKGRVKKHRKESKRLDNVKLKDKKMKLPNGVLDQAFDESNEFCSGSAKHEIDDQQVSVKLRCKKIRQASGALFVAFKNKEVENSKSPTLPWHSAKAISIQALSPNKYMILDSVGNLHVLHLSNPVDGTKINSDMTQLTQTMKVEKLAVLPDISLRAQTVWISDGSYSVHMMNISDTNTPSNENDKVETEENLMHLSVNQSIFAGEKIEDIVPLSENSILILGQGSVYAYAFS